MLQHGVADLAFAGGGVAQIKDLSGHVVDALTMANAPTTQPSQRTSSITTAFMPTKQFFANVRTMHHGTVSNVGAFFEKNRCSWKHVKHAAFLDIDPALQYDFSPIPSQHRMRAHITIFPNRDVSNEGSLGMHERARVHHWHHAAKRIGHDADELRITTA